MKPNWNTVGLKINAGGCEYRLLTDDSEWKTVVLRCSHCRWRGDCEMRDAATIRLRGDMSAINDAVSQLAAQKRGNQ